MKKAITLALVFVLALSLLTACGGKDNGNTPSGSTGGNSSTTTPPASQGGNDTTPSNNGGNSKLVNEWPKAIYDTYNIPAYTDGKIVCVDESPYRVPSAEILVDGSAVFIADATFSKVIDYLNALKSAGVCDNTATFDTDLEFFKNKEKGSGSVTITLSGGKILQISWWGYEAQQDFYYDSAEKQVKFTYNLEFFISQ